MNRLASPHAPFAKSAFSSSFSHQLTDHGAAALAAPRAQRPICKAGLGVALFVPIHYERRYAYPLLIWLHGDASSERELRQLMPRVSVRNYVGAAARGGAADRDGASGYMWPQTAEGINAAAESVAECIEHAQRRCHIHPQRIFLAGHGAGGTMALRLALGYSLPLAGAISLGGSLPRGNCPLARLNEARRVPLMLMTRRGSQTYPPQRVADDLRLLHAAGCKLDIREYLCGDELYSDMFTDIDQWLMQRVCGAPAVAPA